MVREYDIFIMLMESSFERQIGESPWIPSILSKYCGH